MVLQVLPSISRIGSSDGGHWNSSEKIPAEIQKMMNEMQCEPEPFTGRIIFMSMYNDVVWEFFLPKKRIMYCEFHDCGRICKKILGHWSFLGPGSEKKRCGSNTYQPKGEWEDVAEHMLLNFSESGLPVFRGTSALERGTLKSKGGGNLSFHFCGDQSNC